MHGLRYTEHKLLVDARPRIRYEYIVTGRGEFPWDMLRYDACWPATSTDVAKMTGEFDWRMPRSVVMRSYSKPTIDRWSSFNWSCGTERLDKDFA
jgi:hypothetical protein